MRLPSVFSLIPGIPKGLCEYPDFGASKIKELARHPNNRPVTDPNRVDIPYTGMIGNSMFGGFNVCSNPLPIHTCGNLGCGVRDV